MYMFIAAMKRLLNISEMGPTDAVYRVLEPLLLDLSNKIDAMPEINQKYEDQKRLDDIMDMFHSKWFDNVAKMIAGNMKKYQHDSGRFDIDEITAGIAAHVLMKETKAWTRKSNPFTTENINRSGIEAFFRVMANNAVKRIIMEVNVYQKRNISIHKDPDEDSGQYVVEPVAPEEDDRKKVTAVLKELNRYIKSKLPGKENNISYAIFLVWLRNIEIFGPGASGDAISVSKIIQNPAIKKLTINKKDSQGKIVEAPVTRENVEERYTKLKVMIANWFEHFKGIRLTDEQKRRWNINASEERIRKIQLLKFMQRIATVILMSKDDGFQTPEEVVKEIRAEKEKKEK